MIKLMFGDRSLINVRKRSATLIATLPVNMTEYHLDQITRFHKMVLKSDVKNR